MTESTTSSPHDAVFKTFMFTPETARDFLEIHLPEPLRKLCNLQTLRLEPTSFIEKSLRAYYSKKKKKMFCGPWKPATVTAISTA